MSTADAAECAPLLRMANLHKWFGGVHALDDAYMVIQKPGVVHALMGQNGSGKSTMLNVLSGQLRPDSGTIELNGREVFFRSPPDALAQGISMVSQETALAEHLSIAENILLGRRLVRGATGIDWEASRPGPARSSPASESTTTQHGRCPHFAPTRSRWWRSPGLSRPT